jgi:ATP-dependent DNA helicase RecG
LLIFAEKFLPTPRIDPTPMSVSVVLRNTTTLGEDDRAFVARIGGEELSDEEFRALLQAHRNTQVDNASLRSLIGLDTLGASQILRRLRDRGLLDLHPAGSQSFYTLAPRLRSADAADRGEHGPDRGEQQADRGEQLDSQLVQAIQSLGARPRKERLRAVIEQLCTDQWRPPSWLGQQLGIDPSKLVERHLGPMVRLGALERRHPGTPTHADQAYRATLTQGKLQLTPPG